MTATAPIPAASPHDVDLSQVMFRQALREARRAADYAERAATEEAAGGTGLQLRMRERDAVTTTIILTQAAAEAFFNWTHILLFTGLMATVNLIPNPKRSTSRPRRIRRGRDQFVAV
ncbi:hypothetical protein ACWGHM_36835 [Streptomyces sp. NPDC054904]